MDCRYGRLGFCRCGLWPHDLYRLCARSTHLQKMGHVPHSDDVFDNHCEERLFESGPAFPEKATSRLPFCTAHFVAIPINH